MRFHRHWFAVRIEKRGKKLFFNIKRYSLFSGVNLVYEDEKPLTGNRIALWTYDHAIMISRVRISGDGGGVREHPDRRIPPLKTMYDQP